MKSRISILDKAATGKFLLVGIRQQKQFWQLKQSQKSN